MIDRIQRKDRGCGIAVDIDVYACVSVDSCVYIVVLSTLYV